MVHPLWIRREHNALSVIGDAVTGTMMPTTISAMYGSRRNLFYALEGRSKRTISLVPVQSSTSCSSTTRLAPAIASSSPAQTTGSNPMMWPSSGRGFELRRLQRNSRVKLTSQPYRRHHYRDLRGGARKLSGFFDLSQT